MITPAQLSQPSKTSLLAQKGFLSAALNSLDEFHEPWIINSSAIDHVTGCANFLLSYTPSPGNLLVKIANSLFSVVAGTGTIEIAPNIFSKFLPHVQKLSTPFN